MGDNNKCELAIQTPEKIVKSFIWKIKNFSVASLPRGVDGHVPPDSSPSIQFDIGANNIGFPSSWKLSLCRWTGNFNHLWLHIARTGGQPEASKFFTCHATVKNKKKPHQDLIIAEFNQNNVSKQFGSCDTIVEYAVVGNKLEIHVQFELILSNVETLFGVGSVLNKYGNLLESGDNSDFVIQVKDGDQAEIMRVHKLILGAGSSVFKIMLGSGMKEAQTGKLVITDLSLACVKILLQFIYTGKMDKPWKDVAEELVHAAQKYDLQSLLDLLNQNLHVACTFANAMKLRRVAKLHELGIALKNVNKFIAINIDQLLD